MQLRNQAIYCLPDGTCARATYRPEAGAEHAWQLRHPDTDALLYTIGRDGRLTGYAIEEQASGAQVYDSFPTDITIDDLQRT